MSQRATRAKKLGVTLLVSSVAASLSPLLASPAGAAPPAAPSIAAVCVNTDNVNDFTDLGASSGEALDAINCLVDLGLVNGTGDGTTFSPTQSLTRQQGAALIVRIADAKNANDADGGVTLTDVPATGPDQFTDDEGSTLEDSINRLAGVNIIVGKTDTIFDPTAPLTRGQFASLIDRMETYLVTGDVAGASPWATTTDYFTDDNGSVHEAAINRVAEQGILRGDGDVTSGVNDPISRTQAALVIARVLAVNLADGLIDVLPVPGAPNADFTVVPGEASTIEDGEIVQFTASGIDADTVDIVLFECEEVGFEGDTVTFQDDENNGAGNNRADQGTVNAFITVINGVATGDGDEIAVGASGTVTFTVMADGAECYVPVVFADVDDDDNLDLDADNEPTEAFGVGGKVTVLPSEAAPFSDPEGCVIDVDTEANFFTLDTDCDGDADVLINYTTGDFFGYDGALITMAQFEAFLTTDDYVDVENYNPGASVIDIEDDVPNPPTGVEVTAEDRDDDDVLNDVTVTWDDATGGFVIEYDVEIYETDADATNDCDDGVFVDDVSNIPAAAPNEAEFDNLPDDEYCAVVYAESATFDFSDASDPAEFEIDEDADDVTAPLLIDTDLDEVASPAVIGDTDVIAMQFNEPMIVVNVGPVFRFTDPNSEIWQVTCVAVDTAAAGEALCLWSAGDANGDGDTVDAVDVNSLLTVTLVDDPVKVGGPAGDAIAQVPSTITELGPTFDDVSGNQVDLAASTDTVIDNEL